MTTLSIDELVWSPDGANARALLKSIALDVQPGEFAGLIGPNGNGKTSLLRCAFRFAKPQRGVVALDGDEVWAHSARWSAQRIAVLLQDLHDDFGLSVGDVVAMGRTPHKRALEGETPEDRARLDRALADVDLTALRTRVFATLSGGERQRALLARALVQTPRVLMLDEATDHLDPRHQLNLPALVKRQRITTLATIHDLNLAAAFCDRLYVIHAGEIVAHGTPQHVLTEALLKHAGANQAVNAETGTMNDAIVWQIRLPRVLLGALVGAALAVPGAVLQAATANRLADPHLLGVSAGASVGAVAATLWIGAAWGALTLPACAFAATAIVIACSARGPKLDAQRLLLAGGAISFVLMALANLLLYLGDQRAAASVLFWMLGGLGLARWNALAVPAALVALALLLLAGRRRKLDALMSGDISAVTLGVNVARAARTVRRVLAAHGEHGGGERRIVGAGHARLLPAAALVGAIMLVWADVAARTLIAPDDLPIGVVTGLFGDVFFVWLVRRTR